MISFDLELTGIRTEEKIYPTDTPVERYRKCYKTAKKCTIIQLGLSIFSNGDKDPKKETYEVHSFNFYLFPCSHNEKFNVNFCLEADAIEFLNKHETIDYNKWITKGITYFNRTLQKSIGRHQDNKTLKDILEKGVTSLIFFQGSQQEKKATDIVENFRKFMAGEDKEFVCDEKMFVFRKKLLDVYFKEYKQKHHNSLFITQDNDYILKFVKCSPKEKQ